MFIYTYEPKGFEYLVDIEYTPHGYWDSDHLGTFVELDYLDYDSIVLVDSDDDEHQLTIDELEDLIGYAAIADINKELIDELEDQTGCVVISDITTGPMGSIADIPPVGYEP